MIPQARVVPTLLLWSLLSLLLLVPLPSLAGQAPADEDVPAETTEAPSESFVPESARLLDASERPPAVLRILAEMGGVLVGQFVGTFVGLIAASGARMLADNTSLTYAAFFVPFGSAVALGAYIPGQLMGGEARWAGPFLGALVGCAAGLLINASIGYEHLGPFFMSVLIPMPFMMLGAIIGYEVTEHGGKPRTIQPLVSFSSRGAAVGLAGTF
ncbi:hypothetical protein [Archangium primigenium]|uniref:hypothetical protein n=1 Tax=[Archangium] primigenium TaxID=2792470 RepID=UPI00195B3ED5|nr:hypothetical protein [Archangium primigenium]MBM7115569.1 hypothetical protein [Archangium primigenium]